MAARTSLLDRPTGTNGSSAPPVARAVTRRRSLPGGRAVVGGLLVTASAVGLFAAYGAANGAPGTTYVTMAHEVRPGHVLTAADLRLVAIDLPAAQRAVAFTDPRRLVGTVTLGRLRGGELVQSADVAQVTDAGARVELSVGVEPGRAMNGDREFLRGGELVDVVVTFVQGGTPLTRTVATDATVVAVLAGDRSLGTSGELTVVLSIEPADAEAVAGAAAAGEVTLVRTTGLRR